MKSAELQATIGVRFQLECRDADGNLLKTIEVNGTLQPPKEDDGLDDQRSGQ